MYKGSPSAGSGLAVFGYPPASVAALWLALLLPPTPATGQIITGRVLDASDSDPIEGVQIALVDQRDATRREVVSNSAGAFIILFNTPGMYLLRASRIGYASVQTPTVEIGEGEVVEVELRLDVEAVELEPLVVVVRRSETQRERDLRGYYERIDRYGEPHIGRTQIYTREALANWDAFALDELFGVYVLWHPNGTGCKPKVFRDGKEVYGSFLGDLGLLSVSNFEGIELYAGTGPDESRFWDPNGCGVILAWSRTLPEGGGGLGLVELLALGGAAVLLALQALSLLF